MSHPPKTYELRIAINVSDKCQSLAIKERVRLVLNRCGIDSFVEGEIVNVDVDNEPGGPERDFYGDLGGAFSPISVFKYDREHMDELAVELEKELKTNISISFHSMETEIWMEGWKESFRPIESELFYVYPPWEKLPTGLKKIPIVIEPGMAFGTGQHATTQLCIRSLEKIFGNAESDLPHSMLDVGTGTAILSIAAAKLGCKNIDASDIDPDSILAARRNIAENGISTIRLMNDSTPPVDRRSDFARRGYEIVVANILPVVLRDIMSDLINAVAEGGILLLSGFLNEQEEELNQLVRNRGLSKIDSWRLDGWTSTLYG